MNPRIQTGVKYIASICITIILVAGGIYAASITNLTQTANSGDTITSQWVNAVNTSSASAAGRYSTVCMLDSLNNITCIRTDGLNGATECKVGTMVSGYSWTPCTGPW